MGDKLDNFIKYYDDDFPFLSLYKILDGFQRHLEGDWLECNRIMKSHEVVEMVDYDMGPE